ncbi:MAG: hypothetical protein GX977_01325 [Firmicutes bacterium]|nr:hypothetical protein [Bacillota bacterium]
MLLPKHSLPFLAVTVTLVILASGCTSLTPMPPDVEIPPTSPEDPESPPSDTPTPPILSTLRGVIEFEGIGDFTPSATVHIGSHQVVSDDGQFTISGLEAGKYEIHIMADHFHTYKGSITIASESVLLEVTMKMLYTPEEMDLFARLVYAESAGEPAFGQIAVAASVLNRLADSRYPDTLRDVIMQTVEVDGRVYYQYSPILDGRIWELDPKTQPEAYATSMEAIFAAIAGEDPSQGATGFYNPSKVSPTSWVTQQPRTVRIGNHQFFL